jgi:hypothetical protein
MARKTAAAAAAETTTTTENTTTERAPRGKRQRLRYEFILQAATPIAHAAENIGNESIAARRKVRQRNGFALVPMVSGDAMRHGMRAAASYALLDAAGLLDSPSLSEGALRLLFAGGMVTGKGDASVIKLDHYRELCELVPSLRIFGGCCDNRVIPGQSVVEDAMLICTETQEHVPPQIVTAAVERSGALVSCREHIEEEQRVRMDPALVPAMRHLMSADAQVAAVLRLASSETAHADGDAVEAERSKSTMMPRRAEVIAIGSLFSWAIEAECIGELEVDTFHVSAAAFLARARVGGKQGTGHGLLRPVYGHGVHIARPAEALYAIDALAIQPRVGELFKQHVAERKDRIASWLRGAVNA